MLEAAYRWMETPLLRLIRDVRQDYPNRPIGLLLPSVVKAHWWQFLLHTHRALRLRSALLRHGGSQVIVISVPWYLHEPRTGAGISQNEKTAGRPPQVETDAVD